MLIFLAGGLGTLCRYGLGKLLSTPLWAYGTMTVNVVGAFVMGLIATWTIEKFGSQNEILLVVGTGFLGGFTTFSAFALDSLHMWQSGRNGDAFIYAFLTLALGFFGCCLGMVCMKRLM